MCEIGLYFIVSLVALVCDLGAFSLTLRFLNWSWWICAPLGFLVGVGVAYFLSIQLVFKSRAYRQKPQAEMLVFFSIGVLGLVITQLVLWLCIEGMGLNPEASRLGAAGLTFFFNFMVRKFFLFRSISNEQVMFK